MNNSINSQKLTTEFNQSKPAGLILASYLSLQRLNRSKYQLEQIAAEHPEPTVRKDAIEYLGKNEKLISIAIDLIDRLRSFSTPVTLEAINKNMGESLLRLKMEVDILDDMHFEVAKSYSPFIYKNYEATVITMNQDENND